MTKDSPQADPVRRCRSSAIPAYTIQFLCCKCLFQCIYQRQRILYLSLNNYTLPRRQPHAAHQRPRRRWRSASTAEPRTRRLWNSRHGGSATTSNRHRGAGAAFHECHPKGAPNRCKRAGTYSMPGVQGVEVLSPKSLIFP